jgi:S-formylglutathione hydrolase FrmB
LIEDLIEMKNRSQPFLPLLFLLFAALTGACHQEPAALLDRPRLTPNVILQDVAFHSRALGRDMPYRVVLPKGIEPARKLAVVYLLHGGGGGFRDWTNYSDVAAFAEHGLILVMPEGNSSYYTNSAARPEDRYEDYIVNDLIGDVEQRFPVAHERSKRAIVGISMGGFGAVKLALKYPGLFAFAAGLSSAIDVPSRPFSWKRVGQYREHAAIFGAWGSQSRKNNDPSVLARSADPAKTPYLFLSCGEQEGLLAANRQFASLLRKHNYQFEFSAGPGGHDWNQWNRRLPALLQSLRERVR